MKLGPIRHRTDWNLKEGTRRPREGILDPRSTPSPSGPPLYPAGTSLLPTVPVEPVYAPRLPVPPKLLPKTHRDVAPSHRFPRKGLKDRGPRHPLRVIDSPTVGAHLYRHGTGHGSRKDNSRVVDLNVEGRGRGLPERDRRPRV